MNSITKVCSVCKIEKNITDFYLSGSRCKSCTLQQSKIYREINKKAIQKRRKERYQQNIEQMRKKGREDAAKYKEINNERSRKWHAAHKVDANSKRRKHKEDNPEIYNIGKIINKGRRHGYEVVILDYDITLEKLVKIHGAICHICGKPINMDIKNICSEKATIDHIIPMSRGGAHSWGNTAPAHYGCNSRKSDKIINKLPSNNLEIQKLAYQLRLFDSDFLSLDFAPNEINTVLDCWCPYKQPNGFGWCP